MKCTPAKKNSPLPALAAACCLLAISAQASITITPSAPIARYSGPISVTATVPAGAAAQVQMILDFNANGAFDAGDAIIMHYDVQDSSTPPPAGAQLVADLDGAVNGSISVRFRFFTEEDGVFAGHYVFRVKTASSDEFAAWQASAPSAAQSISGQAFFGGTTPVPAVIAIMDQYNNGFFIMTGPDGKYSAPIEVPGREYALRAYPLSGSASAPTQWIPVSAGQHVENVNLEISALPYRWQGRIIRADTNAPLPYMPFGADRNSEAEPGDPFAYVDEVHGWTDENGYFDVPISNGCWEVYLDSLDTSQRGLLEPERVSEDCGLMVSGGNVTGTSYALRPICAFATGRAENVLTHEPLEGATIAATPPGSWDWVAKSQSDSQGRFAIGLPAGQWNIRAQLEDEGVLFGSWMAPDTNQLVAITCGGSSQDAGTFGYLPADRHVDIQVVLSPSTPLQDMDLYLYGDDSSTSLPYYVPNLKTGPDGHVTIPTRSTGVWWIGVNNDDLPSGADEVFRHRLDIVEEDGGILTVYPRGARRPYRVYGSNERLPTGSGASFGPIYPKDYGCPLLGRATGTEAFSGSFPYYYIVTYDGFVWIDALQLSNNATWYIDWWGNVTNLEKVSASPDGQFAVLGEWNGQPSEGFLEVNMEGSTAPGIVVYHPDDSPEVLVLKSILGLVPALNTMDRNEDGVLDVGDLILTSPQTRR